MNLYQFLNQDYREFRMKQSLKENEKTIKTEADVEKPSAEEFKKDDINILKSKIKEKSDKLTEIDEALKTAAPDEKTSLQEEKANLEREVSELEKELKDLDECDSKDLKKESDDEPEDEVSEEVTEEISEEPGEVTEKISEEVEPVLPKIEELSNISKESLVSEIEALSDEEKESIKATLNTIKEVACELFPDECSEPEGEIEEAGANLDISAGVDVPDDLLSTVGTALLASEDKTDQEEIQECEISNFRIVRKAPKSAAVMLEAQTKEGIRYITGKNFDEKSKTLDEAEISDSKQKATNRFKSLLENK